MEEELRSGIETLKDISEGAVPPEISIEEAKAILKRYKELEEEVEIQDKTIDKLVEEQEEREKYVHSLEEENAKLRIDNTEKLCEECSELAKEAGITEEDTSKILKDYRDKVENSIPISVIQNEIDKLNRKITIFKRDIRYCQDRAEIRLRNDEIYVTSRCRDVLKEIIERKEKTTWKI